MTDASDGEARDVIEHGLELGGGQLRKPAAYLYAMILARAGDGARAAFEAARLTPPQLRNSSLDSLWGLAYGGFEAEARALVNGG